MKAGEKLFRCSVSFQFFDGHRCGSMGVSSRVGDSCHGTYKIPPRICATATGTSVGRHRWNFDGTSRASAGVADGSCGMLRVSHVLTVVLDVLDVLGFIVA